MPPPPSPSPSPSPPTPSPPTPPPPRLLAVRDSPGRGRGVFAAAPIARGAVVEAAPVLVFARAEYEAHGRHTLLDSYTFRWERGAFALALGLGSLFNHASREPARNTGWVRDFARQEIRYCALRNIAEGEELLISYGAHVWFDAEGGEEGRDRGNGSGDGGDGGEGGGDDAPLESSDDEEGANSRLARISVE
jgi:SET domain-containing protein